MSWQIHYIKPEPEIYQKLITDFKIIPQKVVFIDDLMDNVAEARTWFPCSSFYRQENAVRTIIDF